MLQIWNKRGSSCTRDCWRAEQWSGGRGMSLWSHRSRPLQSTLLWKERPTVYGRMCKHTQPSKGADLRQEGAVWGPARVCPAGHGAAWQL